MKHSLGFFVLLCSSLIAGENPALFWAKKRTQLAEQNFRKSSGIRYPSPVHWEKEVIYSIVVDRFNDGQPSNNHLNIDRYQLVHEGQNQSGVNQYRHGGDIKGIIDRLPYLENLGVTSLWITPVLKSNGHYHGYCPTDLTQIDPSFGRNEDFRELVKRAHESGIKVIMDIVINHFCDEETFYDPDQSPFQMEQYDACIVDFYQHYLSGVKKIRGRRKLKFSKPFFKPLKDENFFSRCGHVAKHFELEGPPALFGDFSDRMFDFDTSNRDFRELFVELHKYWIAFADIDGFRLDAAKHTSPDYIMFLSTKFKNYARKLGKKNFFVVGEIVGAPELISSYIGTMGIEKTLPPNLPSEMKKTIAELKLSGDITEKSRYLGLDAAYFMNISLTARDVFLKGGWPINIKNRFWSGTELEHQNFSSTFSSYVQNGNPNSNLSFFELHDWPRFLSESSNNKQIYPAITFTLTSIGIPVLLYGFEQGLNGRCNLKKTSITDKGVLSEIAGACSSLAFDNHALHRQDMFLTGPWRLGSMVPQIDNLAYIGRNSQKLPKSWKVDPYLNRNHELYRFSRQLIDIRKSCSSLTAGNIYFRRADSDSGGVIVFSRILNNDEAIIAINTGSHPKMLERIIIDKRLNSHQVGRHYINLLTPYQRAVVNQKDGGVFLEKYGEAPLELGPFQSAIWIAEKNFIKKGESRLCKS